MWEKPYYQDVENLWQTLKEQMKRNSSEGRRNPTDSKRNLAKLDIDYFEKISSDENSSRNKNLLTIFANDLRNQLKDKKTREQKISRFQEVLNKLHQKRKNLRDKFVIEEGQIRYQTKYPSVVNRETLEEEIKKNNEGVLVDDDLLYFTFPEVRKTIGKLLDEKKIKQVKAGIFDKQKNFDKTIENTRLFPMELQEKEPILMEFLKFQAENRKDENEGFNIRTLFEGKYIENQTKISPDFKEQTKNQEKIGSMPAEQHNRKNIPNYDLLKEEWLKRQKR